MRHYRDGATPTADRRTQDEAPAATPTYYTVLGPAIDLLHTHPDTVTRDFYAALAARDFELRQLLPSCTDRRTLGYTRNLTHFLETIDRAAEYPEELTKAMSLLSELGVDQRKYHFTTPQYRTMATCLRDTFARLLPHQWNADLNEALLTSFARAIDIMQTAAAADTTPPTYRGSVLEVHRLTRDITIVRLQVDPAIDYQPGQYMAVQIPQCPHTWRYLSPTIPANADGYVEFHIRALEHGYFSTQVVHSTLPGDEWILANPKGSLGVSGERPVCMIARNVAFAPMRCILLDMAQKRKNYPLVDVYYGTHYPGELIDAITLANIQAANPWLIAHICAEDTRDPWWLRDAPEIPPNLLLRHGNPLELAVADGSVHNREILVGGGPQIVHQAETRLPRLGVNPADIHHDPLG